MARMHWAEAGRRIQACLPVIGLLTVLGTATLLAAILQGCGQMVQSSACSVTTLEVAPENPSFEELGARYVWGVSALALLVTSLGVAVVAVGVFLKGVNWRRALVRLGVVSGCAVLYKALLPSFDPFVIGTFFLDPTVYHQVPAVRTVGAFVDLGAACAIVAVALAACRILKDAYTDTQSRDSSALATRNAATVLPGGQAPRPVAPAPKVATDLILLSGHVRGLRTLLFASSVVLVLGVLQVSSLYAWGAAIINASVPDAKLLSSNASRSSTAEDLSRASGQDPIQLYPERAKSVPQSVAGIAGAFYTIVLIGIFAPAIGVMRNRLTDAVFRAEPTSSQLERDALLTTHGLALSIPNQVAALTALLGPFLAGIPGVALAKLFQ